MECSCASQAYLSGGAARLSHFFSQGTQKLHKLGLLFKFSSQPSPAKTQQHTQDAVVTLTKRCVLYSIPQQPESKHIKNISSKDDIHIIKHLMV